jgi:chromosome segregation ATPase
MKELEDEQSRTNASLKLELTRLKEQLARSDARCLETKQALDSKSIEIHLMKERVRRIEGQFAESEEEGTRLQEKILILEEEVSKLQADNMELQLQLELESNNVGEYICVMDAFINSSAATYLLSYKVPQLENTYTNCL